MTDGTVYVNDQRVPIASLGAQLDAMEQIDEIWYYREAPEAEAPHENAMKAIAEIANRRVPVAMYADLEFTQRVTLGEPP